MFYFLWLSLCVVFPSSFSAFSPWRLLAFFKYIDYFCLLEDIDHFNKWQPIINSFAGIKISLTKLILKLVIQNKNLLWNEASKANVNAYKRILK